MTDGRRLYHILLSYSVYGNSSRRKLQKSEVPLTAEYALEGVKISLNLLRHAAGLVPVPYVRLAVETAISVIKMGEVWLFPFRELFALTLAGRTCSQLFSLWMI